MCSGSRRLREPLKHGALILLAMMSSFGLAMTPMPDSALADITGQNGSLFLSDHISPNELQRAPGDGSADFDFYRMGLNAKLNLNLNISKFQVGCGGVNDLLATTPACDLDIDYLGFMGINAAGTRPAYNAANLDDDGKWGQQARSS